MRKSIIISFRRLRADKTNTAISVTGLILGLGIVAVVIAFVINELNYNHSITERDRIYKVLNFDGNDHHYWSSTPFVVGETAKNVFAEIERVVHQYDMNNIEVKKGTEFISEPDMISAESTFFSTFGIRLQQGSLDDFDSASGPVAIGHQMAEKYFANANPIGQNLTVRYKGEEFLLEVVAVYEDIPNNSTLKPKFVANINFGILHLASNLISSGEKPTVEQIKKDWDLGIFTNYLMLKEGTDKKAFEAKLKGLGQENSKANRPCDLTLQPLNDIYFGSAEIRNNSSEIGNVSMLILMCLMCILILLIALINYLNLASAKIISQVKNFAISRVCGADNKSIIGQIITESTLIILIALPFAVLLAWFSMPIISEMLGKSYNVEFAGQIMTTLILIIMIALVSGVLTGLMIAYKASQFSLVNVLKGNKRYDGGNHFASKALVVFQFTVFIVFVAVTFVVHKQVSYTFNKDLGFVKEGLITVPLGDHNLELFKHEIEKNPNVISASGTLWAPPSNSNIYVTLPKVSNPDEKVNVNALFVDYDFVKTLGLDLKIGSDFEDEKSNSGVIVNQLAAQELGLTTVIGEETAWGKVVGMVNDFHMSTLHQQIEPMLIVLNRDMCKNVVVRLRTENLSESIGYLERTWNKTGGTTEFSYQFTNDIIREIYQSDIRFSKTIGLLAFIAIVIASLGLFGLSLLNGKRRTKEIGIRKVNGAKIVEVMLLLNRDFVRWVSIAFIIAIPIAYYATKKWLENFAYQTEMSWWIYAISGALAFGIALLTVSWQSWRVATQNPIKSLRYE